MRWYTWRVGRLAWGPRLQPSRFPRLPIIDAAGRWFPIIGKLYWLMPDGAA
jgi:hypothetical protein